MRFWGLLLVSAALYSIYRAGRNESGQQASQSSPTDKPLISDTVRRTTPETPVTTPETTAATQRVSRIEEVLAGRRGSQVTAGTGSASGAVQSGSQPDSIFSDQRTTVNKTGRTEV